MSRALLIVTLTLVPYAMFALLLVRSHLRWRRRQRRLAARQLALRSPHHPWYRDELAERRAQRRGRAA